MEEYLQAEDYEEIFELSYGEVKETVSLAIHLKNHSRSIWFK